MDPLFEFGLCVKAIQRELERGANELMKPLGLTGAQADALVVIGQAQPLALKDLGGLLIAEAGHPSRLVDRLVDAGLVERRTAAGDRRRIELSLTPAGRQLAKRVTATRRALFEAGRAGVDADALSSTLGLLHEFLADSALGELIERRRELEKQMARH